ncbi:Dyp-type peroxidase domain-containing protein [Streptomyces sp. NBC_01518]|uniref:Dyp-type peroxidase domain-containing protein n=1 Tax=Streptomyces sp. NBC_01518 TaxID=2903891 RepID=UPI00386C523C
MFPNDANRPQHLKQMPPFPGDVLDPVQSHGSLLLQITGASAQAVEETAEQALHALPQWQVRWRLDGLRPCNRTDGGRGLARNPFHFTEGYGNPATADGVTERATVKPGQGEPAWVVGGSYQKHAGSPVDNATGPPRTERPRTPRNTPRGLPRPWRRSRTRPAAPDRADTGPGHDDASCTAAGPSRSRARWNGPAGPCRGLPPQRHRPLRRRGSAVRRARCGAASLGCDGMRGGGDCLTDIDEGEHGWSPTAGTASWCGT